MSRIRTLSLVALLASVAWSQTQSPVVSFKTVRRLYDKNRDGEVTRAEYTRGDELFTKLDADGDGVLTEHDFATKKEARNEAKKPTDPNVPGASTPDATPVTPPTAEQSAFFEKHIRPVLVKDCMTCHATGLGDVKADLALDYRDGWVKGGINGPAIVPGDPESSLLISAMRYSDSDVKMPPKGKLSADVIRDFETWVRMGAPDPRVDAPKNSKEAATDGSLPKVGRTVSKDEIEAGRKYWSFTPPAKSVPPVPKQNGWAFNEVDQFLLAEMEKKGLAPAPDADRRSWLRRVTFDVTGLPPTIEALDAFEKDKSTDAHEKVIDRLLNSPQYGERWGRHWLDVARYAESTGKEVNVAYPHAWRYRDYVIDAFNRDRPYDRFLIEQLAGDLMPYQDAVQQSTQLVATGFLAVGVKALNTRDRRQFEHDLADEQIDTTTQAMLGLTVACARCHDHKFDPIPQSDYYAMEGIFLSTDTLYGTFRAPQTNYPSAVIELPKDNGQPKGAQMTAIQRTVLKGLYDRAKQLVETPVDPKADVVARVRTAQANATIAQYDDVFSRFDKDGNPTDRNLVAMGVMDRPRPREARILDRGEPAKALELVKRGVVQVITASDAAPTIKKGSGRLELAEWIASPANPLTARVMVNRIWLHVFGQGLVTTPDNFGMTGNRPSHPELMDWMAVQFVEDGWSVKQTLRRLLLSHAYRMDSTASAKSASVDPENVYLSHMSTRRLEAEAIRDAMMASAGVLELERPEGSPVGALEGRVNGDLLRRGLAMQKPVRSVYLPILRDVVPEGLEIFDFAEPSFVTGERERTNVATQALYILNDEAVTAAAEAFAQRCMRESDDDGPRIEFAFLTAYGRKPSPNETEAARSFLRDFRALQRTDAPTPPTQEGARRRPRVARGNAAPRVDVEKETWTAFCQALFGSAEFRYVD